MANPFDEDHGRTANGSTHSGDIDASGPSLPDGDNPDLARQSARGMAKGRRLRPGQDRIDHATEARLKREQLLSLAQSIADPERREAPDDPIGSEKYPALSFLMSMPKGLDGKLCDSGGLSFFAKGGLWHWSVRSPGTNRKLSGVSPSLDTLFADAESLIAKGEALVSPLKKDKEEKFQENRKKS